MRLAIRHRTSYHYETPIGFSTQYLRLTPYSNRSQRLVRWRINVSGNDRLVEWRDGFGNICHTLVHEQPFVRIDIEAEGIVETNDVAGILPAEEGTPPLDVFLRATPLTAADGEVGGFAETHRPHLERDRLDGLHRLAGAIRDAVEYRTDSTHVHSRAEEVLADGYGVCQDHAHVFIACARYLEVPARYVSGHLYTGETGQPFAASHAWAAAWIDHLGWVSFDVANRVSGTDRHVGIAVALDYAGATPITGVRRGGEGEEGLLVEVQVGAADQ